MGPAAAAGYDVAVTQNVMVAMRDGVRLATDIYLPARNGVPVEGKFPVILERTPYTKERPAASNRAFVAHGYVVVCQDVRGRYASEGRWRPLRDDPNDGFDTAQWIGAQPWSNQRIGTVGSSYDGATQHALAIANAPYVQAMIPRNAMSNFGLYGVRHHGAFELRWMNWVLTLGNAAGTPNALAAARRAATDPAAGPALVDLGEQVPHYALALPLRAGVTPLKFAPDYEAWLLEAMSHGAYDSFWKDHGASVVDHLAEYRDIPVYHVTGWYDSWGTPVANLNFIELTRAKKSLQRLIVGPWIHSSEHLSYAGEAQFTPDAALDRTEFQRRWFDRWLEGLDNGVDREPPVCLYVMGGGDAHKTPEGRVFVGGRWRDEAEWPLARTVYTPYFLHADGTLSTTKPGADGRSSLAYASVRGHLKVLRLLLDRQANANLAHSGGNTPLIHATLRGRTDAVRLFVARGAKVHAQKAFRRTTLRPHLRRSGSRCDRDETHRPWEPFQPAHNGSHRGAGCAAASAIAAQAVPAVEMN